MKRSWSYSEYSLATECPRKYQYIVLDKEPSPLDKSGDVRFGSAIHCALHSMLEEPDTDFNEVFQMYWDSALKDDLKYGRYSHEVLSHMGPELLNWFKTKHASKFKPVRMEERLFLESPKIEGTADFVGELSGVPSVVDFKTAGYRYHKLKPQASLQLHLYAYLADRVLEYPVKEIHFFVFLKGEMTIQCQKLAYDRSKAEEMLASMQLYTSWIDSLTEYPKNYNSCLKGKDACEFFSKCHGSPVPDSHSDAARSLPT